MSIPNTQNVLNIQDFLEDMLKYLKGHYHILNATLPVDSTTKMYKLMESLRQNWKGGGSESDMYPPRMKYF